MIKASANFSTSAQRLRGHYGPAQRARPLTGSSSKFGFATRSDGFVGAESEVQPKGRIASLRIARRKPKRGNVILRGLDLASRKLPTPPLDEHGSIPTLAGRLTYDESPLSALAPVEIDERHSFSEIAFPESAGHAPRRRSPSVHETEPKDTPPEVPISIKCASGSSMMLERSERSMLACGGNVGNARPGAGDSSMPQTISWGSSDGMRYSENAMLNPVNSERSENEDDEYGALGLSDDCWTEPSAVSDMHHM